MSYDKKKAQEIVQNELQSVALHIARLWVHRYSIYDTKWESDISDYFIRIVCVANHTKNGSLKKSWLVEKLNDYFDYAAADCPRVYKDKEYKKMKKCDVDSDQTYLNAQQYLVPELVAISDRVAKIILENEYESCKKAAALIRSTVVKTRNAFYKLEGNV